MTLLEMVRAALAELGQGTTNEQVSAFVRERFDKTIEPKFIPIHRATLRDEEQLRQAREMAARMAEELREKKAG